LTFLLKKPKLPDLMNLQLDENNEDSYMRPINSILIAIFFSVVSLASLSLAEEAVDSPAAYFPETAYTFQPVVSGTVISHAYVVQNRGTAVLEIQKVDTG
jgi:hypothetical protein